MGLVHTEQRKVLRIYRSITKITDELVCLSINGKPKKITLTLMVKILGLPVERAKITKPTSDKSIPSEENKELDEEKPIEKEEKFRRSRGIKRRKE
ncbi:conserved hypothetical protein [Ricinus communis]|uniref:Uncharacterized protein n=1 Tax=Ricinus communis TaxID=3988 RepID=B9RPD7_RICCO|nr:conserved hypothetical protein [Ricinus communis]